MPHEVVVTFVSVDEILQCDHSNENRQSVKEGCESKEGAKNSLQGVSFKLLESWSPPHIYVNLIAPR